MKPHETEIARIRLGEIITERRKELGLTIQQLSERCGVHRVNLSKIEHGQINATTNTLAAIADALRCHLDLTKGKVG